MRCKVTRLNAAPSGTADWNAGPWNKIQPQLLQNTMGTFDHSPKTEVKIAYDSRALYLIFRVEADRYVLAVAEKFQDPVCEDSCVEFFFTPNAALTGGYFNLEMNCGGTMLFHYQPLGGGSRTEIDPDDCRRVPIAHSMPKRIDPEIQGPVTWTVEYAIPLDILRKHYPISEPGTGTVWRANFYKCADSSSHPHWLTWAPVKHPTPKFHLPQFFGEIEFE